jgi:hypothetical protein
MSTNHFYTLLSSTLYRTPAPLTTNGRIIHQDCGAIQDAPEPDAVLLTTTYKQILIAHNKHRNAIIDLGHDYALSFWIDRIDGSDVIFIPKEQGGLRKEVRLRILGVDEWRQEGAKWEAKGRKEGDASERDEGEESGKEELEKDGSEASGKIESGKQETQAGEGGGKEESEACWAESEVDVDVLRLHNLTRRWSAGGKMEEHGGKSYSTFPVDGRGMPILARGWSFGERCLSSVWRETRRYY